MGAKHFQKISFLLLLLAAIFITLCTKTQATSFDVKNYGAKADGNTDDSQAIAKAWGEACGSTSPSTIVIPNGNYKVGPVSFTGPCKASPISMNVQGTLKAPVDLNQFKSQDGWIVFSYLDRLMLSGNGTFDGQGTSAWSHNDCAKTGKCSSLPINIRLSFIKNSVVQNITSLNSKLFHMQVFGCNNITLQNIKITAPEVSLNTDGIHVGRSTNIKIVGANIGTGDDCISFGDGSQQVIVEKVTCGPGHGISIGSLGKYQNEEAVKNITVRNCTISKTQNGVRIKTWPASPSGVASDMHFENIVMNSVGNPIVIDQHYCPYNQCQDKIPSRVRISNVIFKNIQGTSTTQTAMKISCSPGGPCQNVEINNVNLKFSGEGPAVSECSNVKPTLSGSVYPPACAKKSSP